MIPSQVPAGAGGTPDTWYGGPRRVYGWLPWACFGLVALFLIGLGLLAVFRVGAWAIRAGPVVFWPLFPITFFLLFLLFFVVFRFAWWGYQRPWGYGRYVGSAGYAPTGAREILKERYARGEISGDQLRQMNRDLDEIDRR